jgi:flagellar biosynthesis/type III secretory pathway chaperone
VASYYKLKKIMFSDCDRLVKSKMPAGIDKDLLIDIIEEKTALSQKLIRDHIERAIRLNKYSVADNIIFWGVEQ